MKTRNRYWKFISGCLLFLVLLKLSVIAQFQKEEIDIPLLPGEKIWSGAIKEAHNMPFTDEYTFNFFANNQYNQIQPLLLSNKGLWVWSEEPYAFEIRDEHLRIFQVYGKVNFGRSGKTLYEAREYASEKFFPASGKMPDELLFSRPQYNTWIELTYNHNQKDILNYARGIIDHGFKPGVLMIDDTWQEDYGLWKFHPGRFPDPKAMMDTLHQMGFKVMLWICPFVSGDQTIIIRDIMKDKGFLMQKENEKTTWKTARHPALIPWWNGYSALLDFTNPASVEWFNKQLRRLVDEYGVDGFKLDAGDMDFYPDHALSMIPATPNRQCELYAQFGLQYPFNEYRACWKMAGLPLVQRLHDKNHNWEDVQKLIPHMLVEGLAGYTFSCPDMIGGGDWTSFLDLKSYDQELVVRSAQIHALMPMMQFSVAPWRILDSMHFEAVRSAIMLREKFTPLILELAKTSAGTGKPIVRSLEYSFPGQGLEAVTDQFMLGESLLIAPVVKKGLARSIVLPKGEWISDEGKTYKGGKTYLIDVPLSRIPYFRLKKK
jgi:alpha-glucosidase